MSHKQPRYTYVRLFVVALVMVFPGRGDAQQVADSSFELLGYYRSDASDTRPYGFALTLWRDAGKVAGTIALMESNEGNSPVAMLSNARLAENGALAFQSRFCDIEFSFSGRIETQGFVARATRRGRKGIIDSFRITLEKREPEHLKGMSARAMKSLIFESAARLKPTRQ
jgi:hypothetical protein